LGARLARAPRARAHPRLTHERAAGLGRRVEREQREAARGARRVARGARRAAREARPRAGARRREKERAGREREVLVLDVQQQDERGERRAEEQRAARARQHDGELVGNLVSSWCHHKKI
jgi:hypothetical protein